MHHDIVNSICYDTGATDVAYKALVASVMSH